MIMFSIILDSHLWEFTQNNGYYFIHYTSPTGYRFTECIYKNFEQFIEHVRKTFTNETLLKAFNYNLNKYLFQTKVINVLTNE